MQKRNHTRSLPRKQIKGKKDLLALPTWRNEERSKRSLISVKTNEDKSVIPDPERSRALAQIAQQLAILRSTDPSRLKQQRIDASTNALMEQPPSRESFTKALQQAILASQKSFC